jgi:hypothetical protein
MGVEMYEGPVRTGDQFEWAYPGSGCWHKSHCFVEVTDVCDNGEEIWVACTEINSLGDAIHPDDKPPAWNELDHFRDMVRLHRVVESINEFEPGKYSDSNPRRDAALT